MARGPAPGDGIWIFKADAKHGIFREVRKRNFFRNRDRQGGDGARGGNRGGNRGGHRNGGRDGARDGQRGKGRSWGRRRESPSETQDHWSRLLAPGQDNDFLEKTACPACGETAARVHGRLGPTNLKQCRECGVRYVSPRLAQNVREEMDRRPPGGMDSPRNLMLRHLMAERLQNMHREMYSPEGVARNAASLLEVGAGWGHFLQLCRPHYHTVEGIEISKEQIAFARERFDLDISNLDISRDNWPHRHHVIVAWELLDHLTYPTKFLSWAHDHLLPGGQLVLAVPNYESLYRKLLGARWFHFDPARHLTYYTAQVLKDILHKAGFTDIAVHTSGRSLLRERFNDHNQVNRNDGARDQWLQMLRTRDRIESKRDATALDKGNVLKRIWHGAFWTMLKTLVEKGMGDELRIYARRG